MKKYFLVFTMLLSTTSFAKDSYDPCKDHSTNGTKQCLSMKLETAEKKLDATYVEVLAIYIQRDLERVEDGFSQGYPDNELETRLVSAQHAWNLYKEMSCELSAADFLGGSGEGVLNLSCLLRMTKSRTKELQKLKRTL